MNQNDPDPAPLELPPAALNAQHALTLAHHDSEEAIQYERRRVSRELEYIGPLISSGVRARNPSGISSASTQPDQPGASADDGQSAQSSVKIPRWHDGIVRFWARHVCPVIDEGSFRDHLALERTFLGYLRTSLILVMSGVIIAQLFRLQRTANPNPEFGFYVIGKPLSVTFISVAIVVVLVGAVRTYRLQKAFIAGKTYAGGWEVLTIMGLSTLLVVATFALVLGVEIDKSYFDG